MAAVASSRWMLLTGGGWGDPPYYVKRFECLEKRYINVIIIIIIIIIIKWRKYNVTLPNICTTFKIIIKIH